MQRSAALEQALRRRNRWRCEICGLGAAGVAAAAVRLATVRFCAGGASGPYAGFLFRSAALVLKDRHRSRRPRINFSKINFINVIPLSLI